MSHQPARKILLAVIIVCGLIFVTLQAHAGQVALQQTIEVSK